MARETIPSLYNAFLGRPLDTDIWENDAFIGGRIRTEGEPACSSANWCTTAGAVALYAGRDYARGWWLQYFDQAAYRFMGKEPFSRIYSHWMAFPVMYVGFHGHRHNDPELTRRSHEWLRAFWTLFVHRRGRPRPEKPIRRRPLFPVDRHLPSAAPAPSSRATTPRATNTAARPTTSTPGSPARS